MADEQDPYKILGVAKDATQQEISKAYKKLAKKFHPDLNPGNTSAEAKFKEINNAYEKIGTEEDRKKFDSGEFDQQNFAGFGGAGGRPFYRETQGGGGRYSYSYGGEEGDFSNLFENLFGKSTGRGGGFSGFGGRRQTRGEDHHYKMEVDFKDAVLGGEKEITLPNNKRLQVKIPPGIQSGVQLRIAGQGGQGQESAPAGDAYVEIHVRPSLYFKRVDQDLELEVPISLNEAVVGGEVKIPTIDGAVLLKIPAGANSGMRLRVKGKGVKSKTGRGDQINILKVELPSQPDSELVALIKKWGENHAYNPRPKEWG